MFELPKLPYAYDALEPFFDKETMKIHHTKHHQTYVDKLNAALKGKKEFLKCPPEEMLMDLQKIPADIRTAVRNHGGGHVNHTFFWNSLKKGVQMPEYVKDCLDKSFGDVLSFKAEFSTKAALVFGSGWTWLVWTGKALEIMSTQNQGSPISQGYVPILVLDVWEHAYYLKYQNKRPDYIEAFWNVVDWKKVEQHLKDVK